VSSEFKKFIVQFFSYHYFERITLEKIKSSKWVTSGEVASKSDVEKEISRRKALLDEKNKNVPLIAQQRMKISRAFPEYN